MNVFITGVYSSIVRDLTLHDYIVPRPEGVLINYFFGAYTGSPLFGFDLDNEFIAGFGKGQWSAGLAPAVFGFDLNSDTVKGFDRGIW